MCICALLEYFIHTKILWHTRGLSYRAQHASDTHLRSREPCSRRPRYTPLKLSGDPLYTVRTSTWNRCRFGGTRAMRCITPRRRPSAPASIHAASRAAPESTPACRRSGRPKGAHLFTSARKSGTHLGRPTSSPTAGAASSADVGSGKPQRSEAPGLPRRGPPIVSRARHVARQPLTLRGRRRPPLRESVALRPFDAWEAAAAARSSAATRSLGQRRRGR